MTILTALRLTVAQLKHQGNSAFEGGNPGRAEELYTEAISLQPSGGLHNLYANRSAARVAFGDFKGALEDAQSAAEVAPDWAGAVMRQVYASTHSSFPLPLVDDMLERWLLLSSGRGHHNAV
jgi:tetratricopeptide (TPR) repeat protein